MSKDLKAIRAEIDRLDDQIVDCLAQRFALVQDVVEYKRAHDLAAILPERINEVLDRNAAHASGKNLSPDFIRRLYTMIIDEYCQLEENRLKPGAQNRQ